MRLFLLDILSSLFEDVLDLIVSGCQRLGGERATIVTTSSSFAASRKSSAQGLMHYLIILILVFLLLLVEAERAIDSGYAHFPVLDLFMTVLSYFSLELCNHFVHNSIFDLRRIIHKLLYKHVAAIGGAWQVLRNRGRRRLVSTLS